MLDTYTRNQEMVSNTNISQRHRDKAAPGVGIQDIMAYDRLPAAPLI